MDLKNAVAAFAALGLAHRFEILTMLVEIGSDGMSVGDIVAKLDAKQNSVSSQLKILAQAGLITPERRGRQIIYRANRTLLAELAKMLKG
jgi:ArsR family transcriptional regulator